MNEKLPTHKELYADAERRIDEAIRTGTKELNLDFWMERMPEGGDDIQHSRNRPKGFGLLSLPEKIYQLRDLQVLNLSHNELTSLPDAVRQWRALTTLYLSYNQLTSLPDGVREWQALTTLDLSGNELTSLPEMVGQWQALTTLYLNENQLTSLPEVVGQWQALTELNLRGNQLTSLPKVVGQWQALTWLDLSGNELTSLPKMVGQWQALTWLDLSENQLMSLPQVVGQWRALTTLYLTANQLMSLPDGVGEWQALTTLHLGENQLTSLPEAVGQWQALTWLDLTANQLTSMPDVVGQWQALTTLYISSNQLTSLPDGVGEWQALTTLYLNENQLTSLPEVVGKWQALTELEVLSNQLTSLPDGVGQWQALTTLDLDGNQLTSLPDGVGQWQALTGLDLRRNQLTSLPEVVGQWQALTMLHLNGNQLTSLPKVVGQWQALTWLDLSENQLTSLPDEVVQWRVLTMLDLRNNHLTALPDGLEQLLKNVTRIEFELSDNPLPEELLEVFEDGLPALKEYLALPKEPLREAKLILVGEGAAGKSTLLDALRDEPWVDKDETDRQETLGVAIKPVSLRAANGDFDLQFNGWDFGGQERYLSTHQLFFTPGAVYLALWRPDNRPNDQLQSVVQWIDLVRNRVPDAQIIIVVTPDRKHKSGEPLQRHPDEAQLRDKYGSAIIDVFYIDCKPVDGVRAGVEELKQAIVTAAEQLPGMGREVAVLWQQAREQLLQEGKACLQIDRALAITEKLGMKPTATRQFLRAADQLGHLVYYVGDDSEGYGSEEIVIMQPDRLAKAIGLIQKDGESKPVDNGLVTVGHIHRLWDPRQPEKEHRLDKHFHGPFIELMNHYEVSYPVHLPGASEKVILLSQLVPYPRPADLDFVWPKTAGDNETELVQECRIVDREGAKKAPTALMYRLIVRFHRFSLGKTNIQEARHWHRGVVLSDGTNGRALLELNQEGTAVRVTVRAVHPQYLLWVLTREIVDVTETFWRTLHCDVYVPCLAPCKRDAPNAGWFRVSNLLKAKGYGDEQIRCFHTDMCGQQIQIKDLLQHASAAGVTLSIAETLAYHGSLLERISKTMGNIQSRQEWAIADNRWAMRDLRTLLGQAFTQLGTDIQHEIIKLGTELQEQTDRLLRGLSEEGKEGPRMFLLEPLRASDNWDWLDHPFSVNFRVTLICEHSGHPVPFLTSPYAASQGVYEIELNRNWLEGAGEALQVMASVIKLGAPALEAYLKFQTGPAIDLLTKEISAVKAGSEVLKTIGEKLTKGTLKSRDMNVDKDAVFAGAKPALQQLHQLMKKEDAKNKVPAFGDLRRVIYKTKGTYRWVHYSFSDLPDYTY